MSNYKTSNEDTQLVIDFIQLPYVLDVLELNLKKIKQSDLKMKELFVLYLEGLQSRVLADLKIVRQKMRQRGIKVFDGVRSDKDLVTEYLCRGYTHTLRFLWSKIRRDVEVRIAAYMEIDLNKLVRLE
ncbi:hypothetical protein AV545_03795 [Paenibacillus jamilae]|uniref:hypothetical protein n=1 Tax=Paenibacillus jamilae TaxID=114136 RepID=UPI0007ABB56B|nr:hypothetical protein [Paenibacillus jamilae]KZE65055.1 hypothetical protein AV545_03795 [Paenibacillus jamilae]